jgi:RHS repeat-associated protein
MSNSNYQLVYDALGRCVKRILTIAPGTSPLTNPVTTYYVYDGEKPILEYDANTGILVGLNLYGKGIDEILERGAYGADNQAHIYFFQQNHEGSVTLLTDANGSVIERYRCDVFGAPTIYDGNWNARSNTIYDNRFLFTGREYAATYRSTYNTPAFNFYEYRARAYSPQLGRFMSEDPKLFDAGDYNLFRYCHNDPIDFTDPMGMLEQYHETHYTSAKDAGGLVVDIEAIRREITGSHIPETVGYQVTVTGLNMGPPGGQFKDASWGKSSDPHAPMLVKGTSESAGTHTHFNIGVRDKQTKEPVRDLVYTKETIKILYAKNAAVMKNITGGRGYVVGHKGGFTDDVGMDAYRKGTFGYAEVAKLQSYEIGYGNTRWWFPSAFKQISTAAPGGSVQNQLIPLAVDHPSDDHP